MQNRVKTVTFSPHTPFQPLTHPCLTFVFLLTLPHHSLSSPHFPHKLSLFLEHKVQKLKTKNEMIIKRAFELYSFLTSVDEHKPKNVESRSRDMCYLFTRQHMKNGGGKSPHSTILFGDENKVQQGTTLSQEPYYNI